jgi:hypothetical protein
MLLRGFVPTVLVLFSFLLLTPAYSSAEIYSWKDANGVRTYSNDASQAPADAHVMVRTANATSNAAFEPASGDTAPPPIPERPLHVATQGVFAMQLVRELGLEQSAQAEEAADLLTSVRIAPPRGEWLFDQPMTPELTGRLRQLTVAAATMGWLTLTPEQALLAFDTTAALLNVGIPAPTDQEMVSTAPYPIAEMPPLLDFYAPVPIFFPYYIWTPVVGGFWWDNVWFSGFFVLNVNRFCSDRHYPGFRDRFGSLDPGHISHHVRGHIVDHQVRALPASRTVRSIQNGRLGARSAPAFNRAIHPPAQPRSYVASAHFAQPGSHTPRPMAAPRATFARPMVSHRAASVDSPVPRAMSRPTVSAASVHRMGGSSFAPVRSAFQGAVNAMRSAGHGFSGWAQHTGSGFSGGAAHR